MVGACRAASSRSSAPPRSCGCWPGATGASASCSWRPSSGCPRRRCTASCARCKDVGFVEQDAASGQVPARRRAAAPRLELPRRQRAAHARAQLVRRAGRPQRRERPHRHAARGPGPRSSTTCSGPTTAARRSRSAPWCRRTPPRWARCCSRETSTRRRAHGRRPARFTRRPSPTPARSPRSSQEVRERGWAAEVEELIGARRRSPRRSEDRRGVAGRRDRRLRARRAAVPQRAAAQPNGLLRPRGGRAISRDLGAIPW